MDPTTPFIDIKNIIFIFETVTYPIKEVAITAYSNSMDKILFRSKNFAELLAHILCLITKTELFIHELIEDNFSMSKSHIFMLKSSIEMIKSSFYLMNDVLHFKGNIIHWFQNAVSVLESSIHFMKVILFYDSDLKDCESKLKPVENEIFQNLLLTCKRLEQEVEQANETFKMPLKPPKKIEDQTGNFSLKVGIKHQDPINLFQDSLRRKLDLLNSLQKKEVLDLVAKIGYQINYFDLFLARKHAQNLKFVCKVCKLHVFDVESHISDQNHLFNLFKKANKCFQQDADCTVLSTVSEKDSQFIDFDTSSQKYFCSLCSATLSSSSDTYSQHCLSKTHLKKLKNHTSDSEKVEIGNSKTTSNFSTNKIASITSNCENLKQLVTIESNEKTRLNLFSQSESIMQSKFVEDLTNPLVDANLQKSESGPDHFSTAQRETTDSKSSKHLVIDEKYHTNVENDSDKPKFTVADEKFPCRRSINDLLLRRKVETEEMVAKIAHIEGEKLSSLENLTNVHSNKNLKACSLGYQKCLIKNDESIFPVNQKYSVANKVGQNTGMGFYQALTLNEKLLLSSLSNNFIGMENPNTKNEKPQSFEGTDNLLTDRKSATSPISSIFSVNDETALSIENLIKFIINDESLITRSSLQNLWMENRKSISCENLKYPEVDLLTQKTESDSNNFSTQNKDLVHSNSQDCISVNKEVQTIKKFYSDNQKSGIKNEKFQPQENSGKCFISKKSKPTSTVSQISFDKNEKSSSVENVVSYNNMEQNRLHCLEFLTSQVENEKSLSAENGVSLNIQVNHSSKLDSKNLKLPYSETVRNSISSKNNQNLDNTIIDQDKSTIKNEKCLHTKQPASSDEKIEESKLVSQMSLPDDKALFPLDKLENFNTVKPFLQTRADSQIFQVVSKEPVSTENFLYPATSETSQKSDSNSESSVTKTKNLYHDLCPEKFILEGKSLAKNLDFQKLVTKNGKPKQPEDTINLITDVECKEASVVTEKPSEKNKSSPIERIESFDISEKSQTTSSGLQKFSDDGRKLESVENLENFLYNIVQKPEIDLHIFSESKKLQQAGNLKDLFLSKENKKTSVHKSPTNKEILLQPFASPENLSGSGERNLDSEKPVTKNKKKKLFEDSANLLSDVKCEKTYTVTTMTLDNEKLPPIENIENVDISEKSQASCSGLQKFSVDVKNSESAVKSGDSVADKMDQKPDMDVQVFSTKNTKLQQVENQQNLISSNASKKNEKTSIGSPNSQKSSVNKEVSLLPENQENLFGSSERTLNSQKPVTKNGKLKQLQDSISISANVKCKKASTVTALTPGNNKPQNGKKIGNLDISEKSQASCSGSQTFSVDVKQSESAVKPIDNVSDKVGHKTEMDEQFFSTGSEILAQAWNQKNLVVSKETRKTSRDSLNSHTSSANKEKSQSFNNFGNLLSSSENRKTHISCLLVNNTLINESEAISDEESLSKCKSSKMMHFAVTKKREYTDLKHDDKLLFDENIIFIITSSREHAFCLACGYTVRNSQKIGVDAFLYHFKGTNHRSWSVTFDWAAFVHKNKKFLRFHRKDMSAFCLLCNINVPNCDFFEITQSMMEHLKTWNHLILEPLFNKNVPYNMQIMDDSADDCTMNEDIFIEVNKTNPLIFCLVCQTFICSVYQKHRILDHLNSRMHFALHSFVGCSEFHIDNTKYFIFEEKNPFIYCLICKECLEFQLFYSTPVSMHNHICGCKHFQLVTHNSSVSFKLQNNFENVSVSQSSSDSVLDTLNGKKSTSLDSEIFCDLSILKENLRFIIFGQEDLLCTACRCIIDCFGLDKTKTLVLHFKGTEHREWKNNFDWASLHNESINYLRFDIVNRCGTCLLCNKTSTEFLPENITSLMRHFKTDNHLQFLRQKCSNGEILENDCFYSCLRFSMFEVVRKNRLFFLQCKGSLFCIICEKLIYSELFCTDNDVYLAMWHHLKESDHRTDCHAHRKFLSKHMKFITFFHLNSQLHGFCKLCRVNLENYSSVKTISLWEHLQTSAHFHYIMYPEEACKEAISQRNELVSNLWNENLAFQMEKSGKDDQLVSKKKCCIQ